MLTQVFIDEKSLRQQNNYIKSFRDLPTDTLLISIPTRVALIWSPAKAQFVGSSLTVIPK